MQSPENPDELRSFLGLKLDESRRVVTQEGMPCEVYLGPSQIGWGLLGFLIAKRGGFRSLESLRGAWPDFGGSDGPEYGTIYDAISRLRRLLEPLGVKIENGRELGWRLVEDRSE